MRSPFGEDGSGKRELGGGGGGELGGEVWIASLASAIGRMWRGGGYAVQAGRDRKSGENWRQTNEFLIRREKGESRGKNRLENTERGAGKGLLAKREGGRGEDFLSWKRQAEFRGRKKSAKRRRGPQNEQGRSFLVEDEVRKHREQTEEV